MKYKDYYQILGVDRDAEPDAIKLAYRRLARKYHPDVSREAQAEERFKEVKEAYEVLKDPEKRAAYDQFGSDWQAGQDFRPPPGWQPHFEFSTGFGDHAQFSDFFEALFGGGRRHARAEGFAVRGEHHFVKVPITLEEAYRGTTRELKLSTSDGRGTPGGPRQRSLRVKIPAGVSQGQQIRLAAQGGAGYGGGPAGDLFLEVVLQPHPRFRAEQRNILLEVPVAPWEAALGRKITVPTLGGDVDVAVPPGSQSGTRLRLKGRGLPGTPPGDQFVVLKIMTPPATDDQTRALYERMERDCRYDPRAA